MSEEVECLFAIRVSLLISVARCSCTSSKGVFYSGETVKLYFSKFSDNYDIIIPFFTKYPLAGIKSLDFLDFKKVAELIKNKKHKTMESYKEIVKINSTMNDRRP